MEKSEVLEIIARCGSLEHTVLINYPETETHSSGWREVEPYSFRTKPGKSGEKLKYGDDQILGEHYFCARNCDNLDRIRYFQIEKIVEAKSGNNSFNPEWEVEF